MLEVAGAEPESTAVVAAVEQAQGLANKELKTCSRCGEIREQAQFFDPSLRDGAGGYGRVCMPCKDQDGPRKPPPTKARSGTRKRSRWR